MIRANITFRRHEWIDLKTLRPLYTVQARIAGRKGWLGIVEKGKPIFFKTAAKRDIYLIWVRQKEAQRRAEAMNNYLRRP